MDSRHDDQRLILTRRTADEAVSTSEYTNVLSWSRNTPGNTFGTELCPTLVTRHHSTRVLVHLRRLRSTTKRLASVLSKSDIIFEIFQRTEIIIINTPKVKMLSFYQISRIFRSRESPPKIFRLMSVCVCMMCVINFLIRQ